MVSSLDGVKFPVSISEISEASDEPAQQIGSFFIHT